MAAKHATMGLIQQTNLGFGKKKEETIWGSFKIILILIKKLILMSMSKCML